MTLMAIVAVASVGVEALAEGATIKGKINWEGKEYKGSREKGMTPECVEFNGGKPARKDKVVTNENSTLRNVLLYVKNPPSGEFKTPTTPVVLDQVGCMYTPRVIAIMENQPIKIRNSDDTAHNIHATPSMNREFNKSQPKKNLEFDETFRRAEMNIPIKCDVHPWMKAWCHVFEHPFFSVSGEDGMFSITGLPAGKYTIVAMHEKYGELESEVTVAQDETKELEFTYARDTNKGSGDDE
jgi:plastocyanin